MTDRQRLDQLELLIAEFAIKQDEHTAILEEHSAKLKRIEVQIKRLEAAITICVKGIERQSDDIQFLLRKQIEFESKLSDLKAFVDERFSIIDDRFDKIDDRFSKVDERFDKIETKLDAIIAILQNHN